MIINGAVSVCWKTESIEWFGFQHLITDTNLAAALHEYIHFFGFVMAMMFHRLSGPEVTY